MGQVKSASKSKARKIGYVRVSDDDQTENLQIDALDRAGCDVIYGDHGVSGIIKERKGLEDLLSELNKGDTLVLWKLDRFGRSALHLLLLLEALNERGVAFQVLTQEFDITTAVGRMIYGHLAIHSEFERAQLIERTKAGMEAARKRGKHIGRPRKLSLNQIIQAKRKIATGGDTITHLASTYGVAPLTLSRALR